MSAQLYKVGDKISVPNADGETSTDFVVVDIPSEEGKSGTYFTYTLMLASEYDEKHQDEKGEEVAAEQTEKLSPENPSEA